MFNRNLCMVIGLIGLLSSTGCTNEPIFALSKEENKFLQSVNDIQVKVDILWVIDDSGSMESSQDNLANNFQSFISKFQASEFDYQMAVTSTGAWRDIFDNDPSISRFSNGTPGNYTGVHVVTPDTPNLEETFIKNVRLGITGNADERGLQSLIATLDNDLNKADGFPRADALLAIIVLTDEDDFSHDGTDNLQNWQPDPYQNPVIHDTSVYYDYLMQYTNSTEEKRNFIVNTIGILDEDCRQQIEAGWGGRKIVRRYIEISDRTDGYKGSICDDFSDVMSGITDRILEFTTRFLLNRIPEISTIVVKIDGIEIPKDSTNGWSYDADANAITFHGDAIPGQNSIVQVNFDPAGLRN